MALAAARVSGLERGLWVFWTLAVGRHWEKLHHALPEQVRLHEGRGAQPTAVILDSQSVKTTEKGGHMAWKGAGVLRVLGDSAFEKLLDADLNIYSKQLLQGTDEWKPMEDEVATTFLSRFPFRAPGVQLTINKELLMYNRLLKMALIISSYAALFVQHPIPVKKLEKFNRKLRLFLLDILTVL